MSITYDEDEDQLGTEEDSEKPKPPQSITDEDDESESSAPLAPESRAYKLSVGATSQPRTPTAQSASLGTPPAQDAPPEKAPESITGPAEKPPKPASSITQGPLDTMGPAGQREQDLLKQGPPQYHGWKKVADILGRATAPGAAIESMIGTGTLGYQAQLRQAEAAADAERKQLAAPLDAAYSQARTAEQQALADKAEADAQKSLHPQVTPKEEQWSVVPGMVGPGGKVLQEEKNSGQLRWADKIEGVGPLKETTEKPTEAADDAKYEAIVQKHLLKQPTTAEEDAFMQAYKQRKTLVPSATFNMNQPTRNDTRSDKSFQYNNSALDKVSGPIDQISQRMGRLQDTLNQNTPQADALVAPELLSVMSGGQGSGLRMNEAEIWRIVGGRSKWEDLKASINKWSTDPKEALSITPEQRQEIRALTKTVQDKLLAKQRIIDDARQSLIDADDPKEHRRIVADTKKKLDAIDEGSNQESSGDAGLKPPKEADPGMKWQHRTVNGKVEWRQVKAPQ